MPNDSTTFRPKPVNRGEKITAPTFAQKWGDDPFTESGHTQTPNALIDYAARLKIPAEECWLIVCILKFKHTADDPYPSQARLALLIGQSEDTVRRLLKRTEKRGLMAVVRVRGDMGHYTHSVYDFTPLRAALNECYYQDHPEQRPTTVQNRTVVTKPDATPQKGPTPPRKITRNYPAKSGVTTVQSCGPNKTLEEREKKEEEKTGAEAASPPVLSFEGGENKEPPAPERPEPWRVAYHALPDAQRRGWQARASAQAAARGIKASDVPRISALARQLFREDFEAEKGGGA